MLLQTDQPVGVFDSGIGGLTVAKALVDALPNESIIYFGDTVHLPYGDKSVRTVQNYSKKIVDFLLDQNVKLIVIACNSASAAAYEMLSDYVNGRALLINVIDPVVEFLSKKHHNENVGLIGTKLTVESGVYRDKLAELNSQIELHALATPLLVPIIEEGLAQHQLMDLALAEYLSKSVLQDISALVLGCTHYPVIKKKITNFYQNKVGVIDSAEIVADAVKNELARCKLLAICPAKSSFYVSDAAGCFAKKTKIFFRKEVRVEAIDIFGSRKL